MLIIILYYIFYEQSLQLVFAPSPVDPFQTVTTNHVAGVEVTSSVTMVSHGVTHAQQGTCGMTSPRCVIIPATHA